MTINMRDVFCNLVITLDAAEMTTSVFAANEEKLATGLPVVLNTLEFSVGDRLFRFEQVDSITITPRIAGIFLKEEKQ